MFKSTTTTFRRAAREAAFWPLCKQSNPHWFTWLVPGLHTGEPPTARRQSPDDEMCEVLRFLVLLRRCGVPRGQRQLQNQRGGSEPAFPAPACLWRTLYCSRAHAFLSSILSLQAPAAQGPACVECSIWDLFEKDQNGMFSDFRENMVMSEEKWNE